MCLTSKTLGSNPSSEKGNYRKQLLTGDHLGSQNHAMVIPKCSPTECLVLLADLGDRMQCSLYYKHLFKKTVFQNKVASKNQ